MNDLKTRRNEIEAIVSLLLNCNAAQNYSTTDKGAGALFADLYKNKHRYNPGIKEYEYYDGKRWLKDTEGMEAKRTAKLFVDALFQYTSKANLDEKTQSAYYKFVCQLTQLRNRNTMLNDAKDKHYFTNEDKDKDIYLLNVQNGVLDLRPGKMELLEHSADLLLSKICNVEYDPNATCPIWLKFLDDVMCANENKKRYLQKICGVSLTGITKEEELYFLFGKDTRNGKSTLCETYGYMLGDYAANMKPESLAVKANNDSRQASGDIARLKGVRFVNASEPPKRMIFDCALIKVLTGRDRITARNLYEREFEFIPEFKLVINTNFLPQILDDTVFSSGRVNVISFDRHFEDWEQDKDLKTKLREPREMSGILNWAIEGLRLYYEEGLTPPEEVKHATSDYRQASDKIGNFISEVLMKSDANTKAKDVYDAYSEWTSENGYGTESKGNFFAELKSKGLLAERGTVDGMTCKNVVLGYIIATDIPFE